MITYVDTSSLLKLLIEEDGSERAELIWDTADVLAGSALIVVEARAALAAAERGARLTAAQHREAKRELVALVDELSIVEITEQLITEAADLDAAAFQALVKAAVARNRQPPKTPALLSGGNPQIAKADGSAPVQAYIAAMPGWKQGVGRRLDEIIERTVPNVYKAVKWNSPFYGIVGNGWFLSLHCFTKYVKVTWLNGGHLDPPPPETSKYEQVRYLHIGEHDEIDDVQIRDWIRQAASIPGDDTF